MSENIAIVGAGVTGITSAYYLAKAGHQVTVYDQESHSGMQCSYANGGQISVSNSEVWYTWANVIKGIKWIMTKDAPLLIRPSFEWRKLVWLSKFIWNTATKKYRANTAKTIKMGLESRELYYKIIAEENISFDQSPCGILHIYRDPEYWQSAQQAQSLYTSNGCEWELHGPEWVSRLEPAMSQVKGLVGGAYTPSDWVGDIHAYCREMTRVLEEKYQVKFNYNSEITSLKQLNHYDVVVVSGGVGSVALANSVGDSLPIYPVKGYSITINNADTEHLPFVSLLDDQAKIVTSTLGTRLRVAGTAEFAGENYDIRRDRIEPLLKWVKVNFPKINTEDYSQWACLRPMTPDMLPIVKQSPREPKVFYNCGHGHLGWTLAPVTAVQLTKLINHEANKL